MGVNISLKIRFIDFMNSQLTKSEMTSFENIARVLRENFPYYTGWKFVEKKGGNTHYCALAYLEKKKGYSEWRIRFNMIDNVLEKYGLSHDESIKERLCTVNGCRHAEPLVGLIGHLNSKHKLSASEIADAIERLEHDDRKLPPLWKRIVMQLAFK